MTGIITKVLESSNMFFVDNDYRCFIDQITFHPKVLDQVEYERGEDRKGKAIAKNVRPVGSEPPRKQYNTPPVDKSKYWDDLESGYFDSNGCIKEKMLIDYPMELAAILSKNYSLNKSTQLYKFFEYARNLEGAYRLKKEFNEVKGGLLKLVGYVNRAKERGLVSQEFYNFIEKNVKLAKVEENSFVKGFMPHFEAVICFIPIK